MRFRILAFIMVLFLAFIPLASSTSHGFEDPQVEVLNVNGEIDADSVEATWDANYDIGNGNKETEQINYYIKHSIVIHDIINEPEEVQATCYQGSNDPTDDSGISLSTFYNMDDYDPGNNEYTAYARTDIIAADGTEQSSCIEDIDATEIEDSSLDVIGTYEDDSGDSGGSGGSGGSLDAEINVLDSPVDYATEDEFRVTCEGQDCPSNEESVTFEACGFEENDIGVTTQTGQYTYTMEGDIIPQSLGCGFGTHEINIEIGDEYVSDTFEVKEGGDMDPHSGDYLISNLYIEYAKSDNPQLRNFLLTDDRSDRHDIDGSPALVLQEYDPSTTSSSEQNVFYVDDRILDGGTQDNLHDLVPGDCDGEDACRVAEQNFLANTDFQAGDVAYDSWNLFSWDINTQTPLHDDGDYILGESQIAVGTEPTYFDDTDDRIQSDDRKFFVCREGNTMDNGHQEEVPQIVEVEVSGEEQLYKCNYDSERLTSTMPDIDGQTGDWVEVEQCNTGLDHDGDGNIDHGDSYYQNAIGLGSQNNDPDCDSTEDPSEFSLPDSCEDSIRFLEGSDDKAAFYNGEWDEDAGECDYDIDQDATTTNDLDPEVFTCYSDSEVNNELIDIDRRADYCNDLAKEDSRVSDEPGYTEDRTKFEHYNHVVELENENFDDGEYYRMPAAEFVVPEPVIPLSSQSDTAAKYVDNGFDNIEFDNLHDAMYRTHVRIGSVEKTGSLELYTGTCSEGDDLCVPSMHNHLSYEPVNIGETIGYENNDKEDYIQSWNVAHAGSTDSSIVSEGDYIDETEVFSGGFYGECEDDLPWRSTEELNDWWACSELVSSEQELEIDFYNVPGAGDTFENEYGGLSIRWSEMSSWRSAFPDAPPEGSEDGIADNVKVVSQCWVGDRDQRPGETSERVSIEANVVEGEDTHLITQLPERSGSFDSDRYTCIFGFEQEIHDDDFESDSLPDKFEPLPLFYKGNEVPSNAYSPGSSYIEGMDERNELHNTETAYIVEGSQQEGYISIRTRNTIPTTGYVPDWLMQRSVENVDNAEIVSEDNLWQHHPRAGEDVQHRHPVDVLELN